MGWLKKRFYQLLPVFLFFFITFFLINMTVGLMVRKDGITPFSFGQIALGAIIAAKVFLILDHLSLMNLFARKPLIYPVFWKTGLCSFTALLILLLDRFVHYYFSDVPHTFAGYVASINWPRFWAIEIWFFVLFLHFIASREVKNRLGSAVIRKMFFG
jgi:hypothetical protein